MSATYGGNKNSLQELEKNATAACSPICQLMPPHCNTLCLRAPPHRRPSTPGFNPAQGKAPIPFSKATPEAFPHSRRDHTYPKNSYTPNHTRVLWRSQGIVCTGEISLWCRAARISPLDNDALGWHFVDSSFASGSRSVIEEMMLRFEELEVKPFEGLRNFFVDDANL